MASVVHILLYGSHCLTAYKLKLFHVYLWRTCEIIFQDNKLEILQLLLTPETAIHTVSHSSPGCQDIAMVSLQINYVLRIGL